MYVCMYVCYMRQGADQRAAHPQRLQAPIENSTKTTILLLLLILLILSILLFLLLSPL